MVNTRSAIRQRPIIRVFVSSTFSDLKLERDALAQRVFPKLEQLCLKDGFQFQAIDLRWGVSTEAGLDHRTMRICFEELRRSQEVSPQPNFLILLGNRYGWRPLPEAMSVAQFEKLERAAADIGTPNVEIGLPIDVLRQWYLRDDNNIPPVYLLRSRIGTPCENDKERWMKTEQLLWSVVNRSYSPKSLDAGRFQQPLQLPEERFGQPALPEIVRFQASATEQEIWGGVFSVDHPEQHVLACFREVQNLNDFRSDKNPSGVVADGAGDFLCVKDGQIDKQLHDSQEQLKNELRRCLAPHPQKPPDQSHCFTLDGAVLRKLTEPSAEDDGPQRWGIDLSVAYQSNIQKMCNWVTERLTKIINQQIDDWRKPRSAPYATDRDLEIEHNEHLRFAAEHAANFIGRDGPLERIQDYLNNDSRLPLVIHGPTGCGKTALLAQAYKKIPEENKPMIRFIGVTPRASDLRSLLTNLCLELRWEMMPEPTALAAGDHPLGKSFPKEIQDLQREFRQHLSAASDRRPVVLFLDALDQLSDADAGLQLHWLPGGPADLLSSHVKIVVSCLSDRDQQDPAGQPFATLQGRKLIDEEEEMKALSPTDARTLLFDRWLKDADRTLDGIDRNQENQRRLIEQQLQSNEQCRQPLYLKLLFEEVKLWRSWDKRRQPGSSVEELLEQLVARLSDVHHQRAFALIGEASVPKSVDEPRY
ncbi:MAG: AAA family ATPase, partial [Planctomycetes bacterium]|nr:AAA family ATPase [Planctomycetota bacterium]